MRKRRPKGKKQQPAHKNPPTPISEPEKGQSAKKADPGSDGQEDRRKMVRPRGTWADWGSVIVQTIAAIILFYYTYYSYHMWKAMENSNATTRTVAASAAAGERLSRLVYLDDHRPLIRAIGAEAEISEHTIIARVRLKNRGKVTAEDMTLGGGIAVRGEEFNPFALEQKTRRHFYGNAITVSLEPGYEQVFPLVPSNAWRITPKEVEQVLKGERSLYVAGYAHPWVDPFKLRQEHLYFSYRLHFYGGNGRTGKFQMETWTDNNALEYDKNTIEQIEGKGLYEREGEGDPNRMTVPDPPDWRVPPP